MKQLNLKRRLAGLLACVTVVMTVLTSYTPMTAYASSFTGRNIWSGGSEVIFGSQRTYLFRWSDGVQNTFCIEPGKHMGRNVSAHMGRYNINDNDIPYIGGEEDFRRIALICDWYEKKMGAILAPNSAYTAAQNAIWAVISGQWENASAMAAVLNSHVPGTSAKMTDLLDYVDTAYQGANGLPEWISTNQTAAAQNPLNMTLVNGGYRIELDISSLPELAQVTWEMPNGFMHSIVGNTLVITYAGTEMPSAEIKGKTPASMATIKKNSEYLTIYSPDNLTRDQAMVSAGLYIEPTELFFNIRGAKQVIVEGESPVVEIFRHKETFESNYSIDLQKYCAETGMDLEGNIFDVLEAFDSSQLGNGRNGTVSKSKMTPQPATWTGFREIGQVITDENGHAEHSQRKFYNYNKTYCGGHPEPEYLEVPDPEEDQNGEIINQDVIDMVEAENIRLRAEWEALVQLCEEETDFHHIEEGVAEQMMIEDRDETYDTFINLVYQYTLKEKVARQGYIIHGNHNDDVAIDVVATNASEAGANATVISSEDISVNPNLSLTKGSLVGLNTAWEPGNIETAVVAPRSSLSDRINIIATSSNFDDEFDKVATDSDINSKKGILSRLFGFFSSDEDMPPTVSVTLPEPERDHVSDVIAGSSGNLSYTFQVENHRTEGEIHINKRDMELFREDENNSYRETQGDGTLQGAVYGLFASADIVHPDGKTGVVYSAGDLVALAATDKNGDASFLAFTEESDTSRAASNRAGTWIGHPLILGSYYVQEISRSEGYEMSVTGINLTESNRTGGNAGVYTHAGEVSASGLSHRIDNQDGSWNDTTVSYFKTENGFDVVISGYPENSEIFEVSITETTETSNAVIDSRLIPKMENGNPVYQLAVGGELKLDSSGNPIELGGEDTNNPLTEIWYTYHRTGSYPSGTAVPQIDPALWMDTTVDEVYLQEEINDMLSQIGYTVLDQIDGSGAPWITLQLTGTTNEQLGREILSWYEENTMWNAGAVESIQFNGNNYEARVFYDYIGQGSAVYNPQNETMYIKKAVIVSDGAASSHVWIAYPVGSYSMGGFFTTVRPKMEIEGTIPFGADMTDFLIAKYQPLYERYAAGEELLDLNGNPIPVMEWEYVYGPVTEVVQEESLTPVEAAYDPVSGTYTIHVENGIDWTTVTEKQTTTYRIQAPETTITVEGVEMDYSDYLVRVVGAGVSVVAAREELQEGSYVKYQDLIYPGQVQVYQDGGTRTEPVQVLQRVIKQAIKVTKDISQQSYKENNTYKIHRDPFTVLFGGYVGDGKKYVADFHFKAYLVSDLVNARLLEVGENGAYDYKKLFDDESRRPEFDQYAVEWDKPEKDVDGDLTTLHASEGNGSEPYYGRSIMLPYGTYVIVEQIPRDLVNKHYELDDPQEVTLPFVPDVSGGAVHEDVPSNDYLYFSSYTPEELQERFFIRFNEENHIIDAHNNDGDFKIYKYGLASNLLPDSYENQVVGERYHYGESENAGAVNGVYYELLYDQNGNVIDYGVTLDGVDTMSGISTAVNGKYSAALVPWSVVDPRYGEVINDNGDIGNRLPGLENGSFNFIAFAKRHFENKFYSSKLRVEKLDANTGENIIHEGALFKIYAVSRDIIGAGTNSITGTGQALFETITVTGTRPELEARGDVDNITWDTANQIYTGTVTQPVYDEAEQIFMLNEFGQEIGIFKAFSTEHSVLKADGTISKEKTGYIETYQPLGAGVYAIIEVQPMKGYQKSKPIVFEIYKDETAYYPEGDSGNRTISERYQYVVPMLDSDELRYQDMAEITIQDYPSKLYIHKVEDGDKQIGDENALDGLESVNDKGDLLTYIVRGRKEYLEARGDVNNITWDAVKLEYSGTVTKTFDEWSENLIEGTEAELLTMNNVKPLYDVNTGHYSGYGIQFNNYVREATMSLYEGLQIERTGYNTWEGITVNKVDGKVVSIIANKTGSHLEITTTERDVRPPYYPIWDTESINNEPVELYFYDLSQVSTEEDERTGELWVLDAAGNRISYVDSLSGMAYTKDDYGNIIAYRAIDGEKVLAESIEVHSNGGNDHIYVNLVTEDDEIGLPLYYESGELTYRPERWKTDGTAHEIERLPFGAYIVEETEVPYEQGYIKVPDMGLILRESGEEQHFYFQNVFTKLNLAKVDISTKKEIQGAEMVLYTAIRIPDESERGYHLEKDQEYHSWISGYEYDDNGNLKLDANGEKIPTSKPHWIDHIPVGEYILEERGVPYDQGYVQSESIEIIVTETGNVQTGYMEDDYTGLEIKKIDSKTGEVLDQSHSAKLGLYKAELDADGNPMFHTDGDRQIPVYRPENLIVEWQTKDGADVLASGHETTDEYGNTHTVYDYEYVPITTTKKAYYYITEDGTTMFHYLPVGYYVLVENDTPVGYATAESMLVEIEDIGHLDHIHYYEMPDVPLTLDVWKVNQNGGKVIKDAFLEVYEVDQTGNKQGSPIYSFYTGADGVFTEADREGGLIPEGFVVGDLKPHRIEYIPLGNFVLVEKNTPYGFLKAEEVYFTVVDTPEVQSIEMIDPIPDGLLEIVKRDSYDSAWLLEKATFEYKNKTTGALLEVLTTDETGRVTASSVQPIGYVEDGEFKPYTYEVVEVNAPDSHMINRTPYEFQFQYSDEDTALIYTTYDAINDINQVKVSKKELTTQEELPGAEMMITGKYTRQIVDHWISTQQPHYTYGLMPGWYVLTEIKTPGDGYGLAESIEFEITENMEVVPYIEMFDDHTRVEIEKTVGTTKKLLAGAKLQLETIPEEGEEVQILYQWVTSADEAFKINGLAPGEYIIRELEAPSGYKIGSPMKIVVLDSTDVQTFTYQNYKITRKVTPEKPIEPEKPKPEEPEIPEIEVLKKIGRIEAKYENNTSGDGDWTIGRGIPNTGDYTTLIYTYAAGIGILLSTIVILIIRNRRRK